jgi:hypothetical protein
VSKKFTRFASLAKITVSLTFGLVSNLGQAAPSQLTLGKDALASMTGCYLVDYSYTETESLLPGYVRDPRVYDVNSNKTVKEWIYPENLSETHVRLQHILFAVDLSGKLLAGTEMKHTGEDWEFNAPFLYDFTGPNTWNVKLNPNGQWTRRVTNLDDGLRYQCTSTWSDSVASPEWICDGYAPIPGRETRDMGRKDYQALDRSTRIIAYGASWLERQANTKVIDQNGVRTPLAKELGKNWYVKLPDSECAPAIRFVTPERRLFWTALREVWDEILIGDRPFIEKLTPGKPPRYFRLLEAEEDFLEKDVYSPSVIQSTKEEVRKIIGDYRAN